MRQFGEMEKLQKEFGTEVAFIFVYTREAHPDNGPDSRAEAGATGGWRIKNNPVKINNHKNYEERVKAACELKSAGKQQWRVLVDDMDSSVQTAFGKLPNSAYLISPLGRVAGKWAWVGAEPIRARLKAEKSLKPWTVVDDRLLPLRACTPGSWLSYNVADRKEQVMFEQCSPQSVSRNGIKIELKAFESHDRAKPVTKTLKVKGVDLPCYVLTQDRVEAWVCLWLPGDGVAQVIEDGKPVRTLQDAGFEKGKSIINPYEPEKWKAK
ncbi:MAG: hypothetical protein HPKKFMNG_01290 [Planctomycetes bacterium]|nr:hypothetical protein [Planctomycetota bacterium]HRJ79326.1 hypothetical protein [Planctomycetota bacterium]